MDFIIYIVIGIVAFIAGWHSRGVVMLDMLGSNPDKIIKMLEEVKRLNAEEAANPTFDAELDVMHLNVEKEPNGQLYAYNMSTFVAQGSTIEEIHERAKKRFPGKYISATLLETNPAKELAQ